MKQAELADYGPVRGTMVIRPYGCATCFRLSSLLVISGWVCTCPAEAVSFSSSVFRLKVVHGNQITGLAQVNNSAHVDVFPYSWGSNARLHGPL